MKKYLTKKNVIIVSAVLIVLLTVTISLILFNKKDSYSAKESVYQTVVVKDLRFKNDSIVKDGSLYTYTVEVENLSKNEYEVNNVSFKFYDSNDKEIANMLGYVGKKMKPNEKVVVTSTVDIDIRNASEVEIVVEK